MVPNTLGESPIEFNFPPENIRIINVEYFIVEDIRTARRFFKKINRGYRYI